jgi:hypothetical protein
MTPSFSFHLNPIRQFLVWRQKSFFKLTSVLKLRSLQHLGNTALAGTVWQRKEIEVISFFDCGILQIGTRGLRSEKCTEGLLRGREIRGREIRGRTARRNNIANALKGQLPSRAVENVDNTAHTTEAIQSPCTLTLFALLIDTTCTLHPLHTTTAESALAATSCVKNGQRVNLIAAAAGRRAKTARPPRTPESLTECFI